jgi:hypothetical protein
MAMPALPKRVFNGSLKLARTPIDAALDLSGHADSAAKYGLDRLEAGVRSATGVLFRDQQLQEQGSRSRLAAKERERASDLQERSVHGEREAEARLEEAAEQQRRENAKRNKAAQLQKVAAKEASLDAKAAALAAKKEADRVSRAASKAKKTRKKA